MYPSREPVEDFPWNTKMTSATSYPRVNEICEKINTLRDENNKFLQKIEKIKNDNEDVTENGKIQTLIQSLERLTGKQTEAILSLLSSLQELEKELETERINTKKKMDALEKKLEEIENENKKLQELQKKLECKTTRLALGQVAFDLEQEIWKYVLPEEDMGTVAVLETMEWWLDDNASNEEGKAAQKRWEDLKKQLNWKEKYHKLALSAVKRLRVNDAHPDVDLEEIRKKMKDVVRTRRDRSFCEEIINITVKAKELNGTRHSSPPFQF